MRFSLLFFITISFVIQANSSYSQKTKISIERDGATVKEVIDEIEENTEFKFLFHSEEVDLDRKVSIKIKNASIQTVLDLLFKEVNISYEVDSRKILLKKEEVEERKTNLLSKSVMEIPQSKVNGIVTDAEGQPLPGANVVEKGTTNGVTADFDGNFSIDISNSDAILIVSFIGFKTSEVQVNGQSTIIVTLLEDTAGLDEVVVIGYGVVKKSDLTGSVSSVSANEIKDVPITRIDQALVGKVAGVQVKSVSGEPGAAPQIRVRGVGSISAGVDPLYVVDGFPIDNLQMLNPNDIESLDILKDASATAIYGSRGSNGVVLITTKRGKAGKAVITFDTYYGFQTVEKIPEMKNSIEQANWFLDGLKNKNLDAGNDISGPPTSWGFPVPQGIIDVLDGTNSYDEEPLNSIFRTAPQRHYQLTASGGSENIKYAFSGEYMDQDGIVVNSNFKRYSFRSNVDAQLTDRIKVKLNLSPSFTEQKSLPVTGEGCCLGSGVVAAGLQIHNFFPIQNEDGSYFNFEGLSTLAGVYNPLAVAKETQALENRSQFLGNIDLEYKILDELKLNVMLGGRLINTKGMRFRPSLDVFFNEPATGRDEAIASYNWLTEYTLNYNKSFGLHNVAGLVGFTSQKQKDEYNALESNLYPNNLVPTLNAASGITSGSSEVSEWSLLSYLARVNYNYDNKYFLTSSVRTDGSSRFGLNNKYATFPSVALAWVMSQENFLNNSSFTNLLKLRASYGQSGNNNIGNYQQFATINYNKYPFGESVVGGYGPGQIANPLLTWEKQSQINVGLDTGIFNGRINLTMDYFHSTNTDLLLNVNVPSTTGFTNALQNIGEVENKGWELALNTVNFTGKFEWNTNFNISSYKNEVIKLGPTGDPIYSGNNVTQIGEPLGMFYGYLTDGIFKNQAELDMGPIYNPGARDASRVGDIRFKDVSGPDGVPDGIIDNSDNTIMGSPYPDFYYGMSNSFSYKNINLTVNLQGSQGNDVLSVTRDAGNSGRGRVRGYAYSNNYWKSEQDPGDGFTPRPNDSPTGGARRPSQRWVDDGSFLRITNITLSYQVPEEASKKLMLNSLRLYLTATNPFLFTNYVSFNPDVSFRGDPLRPGNEANEYPLGKGLVLGLNVSL
ncbi:SusC/RagA family TonB-linked outer membrane protein [Maribacter cobaltidurans]|nr:SusC/RagA family TonB-linked outer membrane protein [Maribacter cobaltidurans]